MARFDYGVTIFILTYSLVAVSGYRVEALLAMAQRRVCTIAIGVFMCLAVCVLVCPVWAGQELHRLTARSMDKLAGAVEACVEDYFADQPADGKQPPSDKAEGYKCVLNSKASEDSQANLARWEPAHGRFGFRDPYAQYKDVGAAMRHCAYCVEALSGFARSEIQTPEHVKRRLAGGCASVAARCALVLREASSSVATMTTSWELDLAVAEMNTAVQELQSDLRALPSRLAEEESPAAVLDAVQLFTVTSLLIEVSTRIESVVDAVDTLASLAGFRSSDVEDEASETEETKVKQPASDPDSDEPEKRHVEQV
ncbi:hypothetical protein ACQ4PT_061710 [Festuca glaucescens]